MHMLMKLFLYTIKILEMSKIFYGNFYLIILRDQRCYEINLRMIPKFWKLVKDVCKKTENIRLHVDRRTKCGLHFLFFSIGTASNIIAKRHLPLAVWCQQIELFLFPCSHRRMRNWNLPKWEIPLPLLVLLSVNLRSFAGYQKQKSQRGDNRISCS